MAAGLPVVASDIAALREVIQPEVNGLLAVPDDDPALMHVLNRLVGDASLRRRMGAAGYQLARQKYSLTRCLQETQNVLLAETPGRARAARVA
jgi:glycosyltransferase involved in cell wall biosynthesis